MSATNSIFVLTEQPPYLGKIATQGAAEQIKKFLVAKKRWSRRQTPGAVLPTIVQLMEESDIDMLSTIALARFQKEDKTKFSAEYRAANSRDSVQDAEQYWISEDGELDCNLSSFMGTTVDLEATDTSPFTNPRRASGLFKQTPRRETAKAAIAERRAHFEANMLKDHNILSIFSLVYGPKSQVDSMALLKKIKMASDAPYQS